MKLTDIIHRQPHPAPWAEGEKIPWNDPDFSHRMLREHLSQEHDLASRRQALIDAHVDWISAQMPSGQPGSILDLGCGPGFYSSRLAQRGHRCTGIDFSPASIAYARSQAAQTGDTTTYIEGDIRTADYGSGYDLVLLLYGELNVFTAADARLILEKCHRALRPSGVLVLEPHTFDIVRGAGQSPGQWFSAENGLFSDRPHLWLQENFWEEETATSTTRWFIIDGESGDVTRHALSMQAYTDEQYRELLGGCGFSEIDILPALPGNSSEPTAGLCAIRAVKT